MGDRTMAEYHQVRIEALKAGRTGWGHHGRHSGSGAADCPRERHHHHDDFCTYPTLGEQAAAGIKPRKTTEWDER